MVLGCQGRGLLGASLVTDDGFPMSGVTASGKGGPCLIAFNFKILISLKESPAIVP